MTHTFEFHRWGRALGLAACFAVAFSGPALAHRSAVLTAVYDDCRACEAGSRFYEAREGAYAWTGPANRHHMAALITAIRNAELHGLDPADYHLATLESVDASLAEEHADSIATDAYLTLAAHLLAGRVNAVSIEPDWTAARRERDLAAYLQSALASDAVTESLAALAPDQAGYRALVDALARYRLIAAEGGWPQVDAGGTLRPGETGPRIAQVRARLEATGDLVGPSETPDVYDADLEAAVRTFQRRASLDADGVIGPRTLIQLNATPQDRIDQLRVNLERWRWLPDDLGRRHIRVNIADFSLEARANGVVEQTHNVIVGRLYRRTPVFSGTMTYFVLNPWWETPPSLAAQDKLPLFRRDPGAVQRLGFQVIDRAGNLVDPETIDWNDTPAQGFPYRLRQAPGPLNALGEVKFIFPNQHNVYLHDTPTRGQFSSTRRDFSSGCVRVENPISLAEWVSSDAEGWTPERIRQVAAGNTETRLTLARTIPVHILYWTAVGDPETTTNIRFVDDVYERDARLLAALNAPPPPVD